MLSIEQARAALGQYAGRIDSALLAGLGNYLDHTETGSFLRCVLENDLGGAVARAHPGVTMWQMKALVELLENYFPLFCYGSPEKVAAWLAKPTAPSFTPAPPEDMYIAFIPSTESEECS